jgi:hypothetical protein
MKKTNIVIDKDELVKQEIKRIQDERERQELLFDTEARLYQTTIDRDLEIHELRNGTQFTLKEVKDLINKLPADYFPMFPNSNPFFKLVFKLNKWKGDPTEFIKPPACAIYIKKYIYGRFVPEVLPTLLTMTNPLISGHIRQYKLFQFLNDIGRQIMHGYIDDAIEIMEKSTDWYDFELQYGKKYGIGIQTKCV